MKKRIFSIILIVYIMIVAGCSINTPNSLEIDYDFGIISTIAHKEDSIINYYSFEGDLIKTQKLRLAWLGMGFGSFGKTDENIYVKVDNKQGTIFELNKGNGSHKLYDLSYNSLTMSAEDNWVYFANSNTKQSTISKFSASENKLKEMEIEDSIVSSIYPYQGNLYVSALSKKDISAKRYILDKDTLKIQSKSNNPLNCNVFRIYGTHDKVYFANNSMVDSGVGSKILTEYDAETDIYTDYTLNYDYLYELLEYNNNLIITHLNPPTAQGKNITLFNLETKRISNITLQNDLIHSDIKDDMFISSDMDYVYIYSLPDFELVTKIYVGNEKHYISTLFTR